MTDWCPLAGSLGRLAAVLAFALGAEGPAADKTPPPVLPQAAPDSPRAALSQYLEACRRGDYGAAARFLRLEPGQAPRGRELARRLKAVLDRRLWNGRLADMRVESFSARDRMRLACTLGLVYATRADQMRKVLAGLETVLRSHPLIWTEAVVARFKEFGARSLDVEVMAWFQTASWPEFQRIREEVLLEFMDVVEGAGTGFAFPTRTLHHVVEPPSGSARTMGIPARGEP